MHKSEGAGAHAGRSADGSGGAAGAASQVRKSLGRKLSAALSATLVVYQLGSCAAYLIIIGDTVGPLLAHAFGADAWFANRQFIISFFALAIIMPLCFPR